MPPGRMGAVAIILQQCRSLLWSFGLGLALLAAGFTSNLSHAHDTPLSDVTVSAAESPSDGPCGPQGEAGHNGSACCGLSVSCSASCSVYAPIDAAAPSVRDQQTAAISMSDSLRGGTGSAPPFHPPKLLVIV